MLIRFIFLVENLAAKCNYVVTQGYKFKKCITIKERKTNEEKDRRN
jgi:hypothetical protein